MIVLYDLHALREELKDTNLIVKAVMPSVIDTWRTRKFHLELTGTMVNPSDIAGPLCCICSDDCDALSGSILRVFGRL